MIEEWILKLSVTAAYVVIFLVIYAESGLLIGMFFPGDSLLFTLGLVASQGHLSYPLILLIGSIAAILGDSVGYSFGRRFGPKVFKEGGNRRFFKKEHLDKAEAFYAKHGVATIILARFTPFARTFAPILAGASKMNYSLFLTYNVIGGILWVVLITSLGYFLGNLIPDVDRLILPIIAAIILVSLVPSLVSYLRHKSK